MDFFYRAHEDVAHGGTVSTLTEAGLGYYFYKRKLDEGELAKNIDIIIDYDLEAGPNFSEGAREEIIEKLRNSPEDKRVSWIIHRDGHTVSLIREGEKFLLLDSYNAHGAEDADHLPLLRIVRDLFPDAKIYTLRDKIQNDYCNCRIFAFENLIEIERYCEFHHCGLDRVINSDAEIFFADPDQVKDEAYRELSVIAIPTPIAIIPHIQSVSQIREITEDYKLLKVQRDENLRYLDHLQRNIEIVDDREVNYLIFNRERETKQRISIFNQAVERMFGGTGNPVTQKYFVDRLKVNFEIIKRGIR